MNTNENEKIELNVPESCPKCGNGAFYRMAPDESWKCYFCDPPPTCTADAGASKK
jgi:uncharacterized protein (DUF983 family)